jgi:hypothetical protein
MLGSRSIIFSPKYICGDVPVIYVGHTKDAEVNKIANCIANHEMSRPELVRLGQQKLTSGSFCYTLSRFAFHAGMTT